jgi:hypothetical protein
MFHHCTLKAAVALIGTSPSSFAPGYWMALKAGTKDELIVSWT